MKLTAQIAAQNAQAAREQAKLAKQQRRAEILQTPKVQNKIDELERIIDKKSKDGETSYYLAVLAKTKWEISQIVVVALLFIGVPVLWSVGTDTKSFTPFLVSGLLFLVFCLLAIRTSKKTLTKEEWACVVEYFNKKEFHADLSDCIYTRSNHILLNIDWSNSGSLKRLDKFLRHKAKNFVVCSVI